MQPELLQSGNPHCIDSSSMQFESATEFPEVGDVIKPDLHGLYDKIVSKVHDIILSNQSLHQFKPVRIFFPGLGGLQSQKLLLDHKYQRELLLFFLQLKHLARSGIASSRNNAQTEGTNTTVAEMGKISVTLQQPTLSILISVQPHLAPKNFCSKVSFIIIDTDIMSFRYYFHLHL